MDHLIEQTLRRGLTAHQEGKLEDAERFYRSVLNFQPLHPDANYNLGVLAVSDNNANAALPFFKIALEANPNTEQFWWGYIDALVKANRLTDAKQAIKKAKKKGFDAKKLLTLFSQSNWGSAIKMPSDKKIAGLLEHYQCGRLDVAEKLALDITQEFPAHQVGWKVLGVIFQKTDRLNEALMPMQKSVEVAPQDFEAHNNLGVTLHELRRFDEAEASYRKAIALKPSYAEAHCNLGLMLQDVYRFDEAEASYRKAIALKPEYPKALVNLAKVLNALGNANSALSILERAKSINPKSKDISLLSSILEARKARENTEKIENNVAISDTATMPIPNLLLLDLTVEQELIAYLYHKKALDLDKEKDPSFGNIKGSLYNLFEDKHSTIQKLALDLKSILMGAFKSDIFIYDSFYSIFSAGSGTNYHNHITKLDTDPAFSLANQKFSLVYYLSVGNQKCSEPGILKLYEPSEEILPKNGMITIFSAERFHSSVYGGDQDRVIVGVNFYTL